MGQSSWLTLNSCKEKATKKNTLFTAPIHLALRLKGIHLELVADQQGEIDPATSRLSSFECQTSCVHVQPLSPNLKIQTKEVPIILPQFITINGWYKPSSNNSSLYSWPWRGVPVSQVDPRRFLKLTDPGSSGYSILIPRYTRG